MGDLTKDFDLKEFACKCGCGYAQPNFLLVQRLQTARDGFGRPLVINSGCRCVKYNSSPAMVALGASPDSAHLKGMAADVRCLDSRTRFFLVQSFYRAGFIRIKPRPTYVHVDVDPTKDPNVLWLS